MKIKLLSVILLLIFLYCVPAFTVGSYLKSKENSDTLRAVKTAFGLQVLDSNEAKFYINVDGLNEEQAQRLLNIIEAYKILNQPNMKLK